MTNHSVELAGDRDHLVAVQTFLIVLKSIDGERLEAKLAERGRADYGGNGGKYHYISMLN